MVIAFLKENYPVLSDNLLQGRPSPSLEEIARAKGFLVGSGLPDIRRACDFIMNNFRDGRLGRISLEAP